MPEEPIFMPTTYREGPEPGLEVPYFWKDEISGILTAAITQYLNHKTTHAPAPTAFQIQLIREYLTHFINAPCWAKICRDTGGLEEELNQLREAAPNLTTVAAIDK